MHDATVSAASTLAVASQMEGDGPCCNDEELTARECATWMEGNATNIARSVAMAVDEVTEIQIEVLQSNKYRAPAALRGVLSRNLQQIDLTVQF